MSKRNPVHDEAHARELGALNTSSVVYQDRVKWPKWNVKVGPLMDARVGGALLRRRLPDFSSENHASAARYFANESKRAQGAWNALVEKEHHRVFGRPFELTDYKIAGIARDEYSETVKNKLRELAHYSSEASAASAAHWLAAGRTLNTWRRDIRKNPSTRRSKGRVFFSGRKVRVKKGPNSPAYRTRLEVDPRKARRAYRKSGYRINTATEIRRLREFSQGFRANHLIQVERGKRWISIAAFFSKPAALDYGRALSRKYRRAKIRYFSPDGSVKKNPRAKKNPAPRELNAGPEATAAVARLERFTGHAARRARAVQIPQARAALEIGPCLLIGYETVRDGRREKYVHRFARRARPLLAASSDGRTLFLLGGAYRFTERGIVD